MIAIILATALTFYCFYRLLRLFSSPKTTSFQPPKKPTAKEKLRNEAFEFAQDPPEDPSKPVKRLLILYASEYGFAREVGRRTAELLCGNPVSDSELNDPDLLDRVMELSYVLQPRVMSMAHFGCVDFDKEHAVLIVCSTTGDGVPPTDAARFLNALDVGDVRLPSGLLWATLALGDRGYPHFCRGGIEVEQHFAKSCGKKAVLDVKMVDQEDWEVISQWWKELFTFVGDIPETDSDVDYLINSIDEYEIIQESDGATMYSYDNPLHAKLVNKTQLTVHSSGDYLQDGVKDVIRVEFDVQGSGMKYKPGDALGIVPVNDENVVEKVLIALGAVGDELVEVGGDNMSIKNALLAKLDLKTVRSDLIASCALACGDEGSLNLARQLVGTDPQKMSSATGRNVVEGWEVMDVLSEFGRVALDVQRFVKLLRASHTRYYSISSTPVSDPYRIGITVDVLRYRSRDVERKGVVSTMLKERCTVNDIVKIFIAANDNFRLPENPDLPIIMIGPGTGIAPFIAFLEERKATKATGRNVLFFGCRHKKQDFLYSKQLELMEKESLVELYTAFSRDQPEKVYVQHRMKEVGEVLWALIDSSGAHVYICGDARRMASDVHQCLLDIFAEHGGLSEADAVQYMEKLDKAHRYQRDVWAP